MLTIGPYALPSQVLLAPMAGVTDAPFRTLCAQHGAGLCTTEMLTSDVSLWQSDKSRLRLVENQQNTLRSVQIAGSDPEMLAQAAALAVAAGAEIVDINMGCPAKKVCRKLAGSALLRDEQLVARILHTVVGRVSVPVTLKTRTGWDTDNKNGPIVAKIAESAGIAALAIHGRTRACRFNGNAEYDTIAEIANAVRIPVIANGDIDSGEKARFVLDHTGAAGVMIGRAAFGNPWLFRSVKHYLEKGESYRAPTVHEVCTTMLEHLAGLYRHYGETKGVRIARKHFAWYCQQHFARQRDAVRAFNLLESSQSQLAAVRLLAERELTNEEKVA